MTPPRSRTARGSGAGDDAEGLSLAEAADLLGVHYMTAYRYVRTGLLDAHQVGGQWRVDRAAISAFRSRRAAEPAGPGRRPRSAAGPARTASRRSTALADRLVAGDEAGAWRLVEDSIAAGWDDRAVYLSLLGAALRRVGDRWESGAISVADEHRASVVAMRLVGRLGARSGRPGRDRGTVLLSAAPGDRHGLPSAIVADLLRGEGLRVIDLGADTPAEYLAAAAAAEDRLLAVGICATTALDRSAERRLREAIRLVHERAGVAVVVGGAAVPRAEVALGLGADRWSSRAEEVVEWIGSLTASAHHAKGART